MRQLTGGGGGEGGGGVFRLANGRIGYRRSGDGGGGGGGGDQRSGEAPPPGKNRLFSSLPTKKEPHALLCHPGIVLFWILRRRPKALKFIGPFRIAFLLFQFSVPLPFYAL